MDYKLPKEFAQKGVEALRTTKETQGGGGYFNRQKNSYCAIGIMLKANGFFTDAENYKKFLNYEDVNTPFVDNGGYIRLWSIIVNLNDNDKKSFKEIADWIEENVEFVD